MSTWDRMQPTHMLDGLGGMLTPHKQHSLRRQQQKRPSDFFHPLTCPARNRSTRLTGQLRSSFKNQQAGHDFAADAVLYIQICGPRFIASYQTSNREDVVTVVPNTMFIPKSAEDTIERQILTHAREYAVA